MRRLADGMQANGCLRAMWPGEGPWFRDRMRWVHRTTRYGEAAAPQGVDRSSAEWGDQAGYGCSRARSRQRGAGGMPGVRVEWAAAGACGPRVTVMIGVSSLCSPYPMGPDHF